jgi:hypothetical protein
VRRPEFEGNGSFEFGVFSFIDDSHTAGTELLNYFIMRDILTDQSGQGIPEIYDKENI